MSLSVNALTTIARAETLLGLTAGAQDALLEMLIDSVSARVESYCARHFRKQVFTEKYEGHGRQKLYLNEWPIINQSTYPTVTVDDTAYVEGEDDDYIVFAGDSEGENYLFRDSGWTETIYYRQDTLCPTDRDPNSHDPNIDVTYLAGYVTPQYVSRTVSTATIAAGSSKIITVPSVYALAVGDTVTLSSTGAAGPPIVAAASESCTISAIPSSTTITLTTVANAHAGTITLATTRTFPYDLEEAVIQLIGLKMTQRTTRGIVSEKTPGGYQVQYTSAGELGTIPADIKATLDYYRRVSI